MDDTTYGVPRPGEGKKREIRAGSRIELFRCSRVPRPVCFPLNCFSHSLADTDAATERSGRRKSSRHFHSEGLLQVGGFRPDLDRCYSACCGRHPLVLAGFVQPKIAFCSLS